LAIERIYYLKNPEVYVINKRLEKTKQMETKGVKHEN